MKTIRNAMLQPKKSSPPFPEEEILSMLKEIKEDCRVLRARMVSLESWMSAISRGKELSKSHAFAKNMDDLEDRINPTISIIPTSHSRYLPVLESKSSSDCENEEM
jgi:hypothetical protein